MLLTSAQVSMAISTGIVFLCTFALFISGYVLQQQTVRSLQAMIIKPSLGPQSQYLDISASHLAAHDSDPHIDISSFSTQERLDFEKTVELERHRMRRGKMFDANTAKEYGTNGGRIGGYRSNITPERFRKGRSEEIVVRESKSDLEGDELERGDVEGGEVLVSIDEGGATAAPWAGGKGWGDLDPTLVKEEKV